MLFALANGDRSRKSRTVGIFHVSLAALRRHEAFKLADTVLPVELENGFFSGESCHSNAAFEKLTLLHIHSAYSVEKVGLAEYIIRAAHSNLVLGVEGGYLDISDKPINDVRSVVQLPQTNDNGQKWILEDAKNGYYFIRNTLGWYLDLYQSNTSDLTPINIHPFNGTKAQQFKII